MYFFILFNKTPKKKPKTKNLIVKKQAQVVKGKQVLAVLPIEESEPSDFG